ncbi:MAG: response regulator [Candidatus Marinimicrobia bacterium]|nr:response regulator [Candidatus Neomarinimicrobiota bacterium]
MKNQILIIEDNDDDVLMIKRGFKKGKIANAIHRVTNGKEALEYLNNNDISSIQLLLLDLNMEVMNGFDFLMKREEDIRIKQIPVVVLTSSNRKEDIERAYALGANSYVEKPLDPIKFMEAIMAIENFWLYLAKKP